MPPIGNSRSHQAIVSATTMSSLLVVCNGHGEDLIALRVLEQLHAQCPALKLEVLPLVGQGRVFDDAIQNGWLQRIGPEATLPSGGFSNQSMTGLLADVKGRPAHSAGNSGVWSVNGPALASSCWRSAISYRC